MIRRPPRSTRVRSSAASDVYKRQTFQLQTPGERAQHVFSAFPGIEPESSEQKRSRNSRNVPAPNARRARAAREQGLHATHHTRNLDARVALATLALLCLVVLCSGSSRRLCFSPRVFRRLQCLRLSLLTRLLAVCASLLVFSVACNARFSRAFRSSIARFPVYF